MMKKKYLYRHVFFVFILLLSSSSCENKSITKKIASMPIYYSSVAKPPNLDTTEKSNLINFFLALNAIKYSLKERNIEVEIQRLNKRQIVLREQLMFDNLTFYKQNSSKQFDIYAERNIGYFLRDTLVDVNFDGANDYLIVKDNFTPNLIYQVYIYDKNSNEFSPLESSINDASFDFSNLSIDKKNNSLTSFEISNYLDFLCVTKFYFKKGIIERRERVEIRQNIQSNDTTFLKSEYYSKVPTGEWVALYENKRVDKITPLWSCNKNLIIGKNLIRNRNPFF